jgi:glyoxylase-like metal-dependent hydrolase (beta-lactamase superfamily II)
MRQIGEFSLARVIEFEGPSFDPNYIFPAFDSEVLDEQAPWLRPDHVDAASGMLVMSFQAFVLRTPSHTIIVDSCIGNDKPRPNREAWHLRQGPFLDDLGALGVRPEEVDFVMCTHLHADHVGWNTRLVDGRWVPTFPNARYVFARTEYAFWEARHRDDPLSASHGSFGDSVLPVMEAGRAVLVDSDHALEDGVWLEPAPGHTPGNVVVNLRSGDHRALLTGDVIHHPAQLVRPDWSSAFCENPAQSHHTRRTLIERCAESDTLVCPAHFASPTLGHIVRDGDAFGYRS